MTPQAFIQWLADMKAVGHIALEADAAILLDVHVNSITYMKKHGADLRTAYACQSILSGQPPYGL